jgi:hypothetical protein
VHAYEEFDLAVRLRAAGWKLVRIPVDAVTHYGHDAPPYQLLLRRWRSKYVCGLGELLRGAAGRPHWSLVWRDLRELKLYVAVVGWWLVLLSAAAWPLPAAQRALAMLVIGLLPFAAMGVKKRSISRSVYSVVSWNLNAAGMVRGLFRPRTAPGTSIRVDVQEGGVAAMNSHPAHARPAVADAPVFESIHLSEHATSTAAD